MGLAGLSWGIKVGEIKFKSAIKNQSLFEILFLPFAIITIVVCFFVGKDKNLLSLITSLIGIVSVFLIAKGYFFAPWIDLTYNILYSVVSIFQAYYGEAIIYLGIMVPISIFSIVTWIKHKFSKTSPEIKINGKISKREYVYLFGITYFASIGFYFLLHALSTEQLIFSTLSLATSAVASYLMLRRNPYFSLVFLLDDIISITMWVIAVVQNGIGLLPTVICFLVFFINDIYGYVHWRKLERKQSLS